MKTSFNTHTAMKPTSNDAKWKIRQKINIKFHKSISVFFSKSINTRLINNKIEKNPIYSVNFFFSKFSKWNMRALFAIDENSWVGETYNSKILNSGTVTGKYS